MIVDTSALLAFFDANEPAHAAVARTIEDSSEPLVVSPFVVAETDYLVATRYGVAAELAVLRELAGGAWHIAPFGPSDLEACADVVDRYHDQEIGVSDASNVVLAARHGTTVIATLDHRHFDVLRALDGRPFTVVP